MAVRPGAVIAISLAGVGCGGHGAEPPDATVGNPDAVPSLGDYDDPGDFSRAGCQPGTLAGFVPQAIIHGVVTFPDLSGTLAFRIDSPTAGAIGSRAADRVIVTADDIAGSAPRADRRRRLQASDCRYLNPERVRSLRA